MNQLTLAKRAINYTVDALDEIIESTDTHGIRIYIKDITINWHSRCDMSHRLIVTILTDVGIYRVFSVDVFHSFDKIKTTVSDVIENIIQEAIYD